jgi:hypothetical protein
MSTHLGALDDILIKFAPRFVKDALSMNPECRINQYITGVFYERDL